MPGVETAVAPLLRHLDPLRDERPVEPGQRHDIAHRSQGHQVEPFEQIGLAARTGIPSVGAQRTVDRDDEQKGDPDRRKEPIWARLIEAVRIDERRRDRQQRLGDVMIDDDHVESALRGFGERLMGGRAAIDGDNDARALPPQKSECWGIRPVTLAQAIRDIDPAARADTLKNRVSSAAEVAPSTS